MKDDLPENFAFKMLGLGLVLLGLSILSLPAIEHIEARYRQYKLEKLWIEALQERIALAHREENFEFTKGFPKAEILIPSIGLKAKVVQGAGQDNLSMGPGHISGTGNPGEAGNCCIAAHRNVYGAWFRRLDELKQNEKIIIRTPNGVFAYIVTEKLEVSPNEISVLKQTEDPMLTLITCAPALRPTHRLVVKAKLAD